MDWLTRGGYLQVPRNGGYSDERSYLDDSVRRDPLCVPPRLFGPIPFYIETGAISRLVQSAGISSITWTACLLPNAVFLQHGRLLICQDETHSVAGSSSDFLMCLRLLELVVRG